MPLRSVRDAASFSRDFRRLASWSFPEKARVSGFDDAVQVIVDGKQVGEMKGEGI